MLHGLLFLAYALLVLVNRAELGWSSMFVALKRFTDSCRANNNGKSPLELAGVELEGRDWLSFLLGS